MAFWEMMFKIQNLKYGVIGLFYFAFHLFYHIQQI